MGFLAADAIKDGPDAVRVESDSDGPVVGFVDSECPGAEPTVHRGVGYADSAGERFDRRTPPSERADAR